jgi:hypothetical protein
LLFNSDMFAPKVRGIPQWIGQESNLLGLVQLLHFVVDSPDGGDLFGTSRLYKLAEHHQVLRRSRGFDGTRTRHQWDWNTGRTSAIQIARLQPPGSGSLTTAGVALPQSGAATNYTSQSRSLIQRLTRKRNGGPQQDDGQLDPQSAQPAPHDCS